jgi:hypothetical protein
MGFGEERSKRHSLKSWSEEVGAGEKCAVEDL